VSAMFSTRRSSMRLFNRPAAPGRTAAVPVDLLSRPLFFQGRLAQLFFRRAASSRLAPHFTSIVSSVKRGDPCRLPGVA
jgi:hypothetical protein